MTAAFRMSFATARSARHNWLWPGGPSVQRNWPLPLESKVQFDLGFEISAPAARASVSSSLDAIFLRCSSPILLAVSVIIAAKSTRLIGPAFSLPVAAARRRAPQHFERPRRPRPRLVTQPAAPVAIQHHPTWPETINPCFEPSQPTP